MAPHVFNWKDIDPEVHFKWGAVKKGRDHDGYSVPLQVLDEKTGQYHDFTHIGPRLAIPFGLKEKTGPYGTRYSCDMTFPGVTRDEKGELQGDEELVKYCNWLFKIEAFIKDQAFQQAQPWFGKELKKDVLEEFYFKNIVDPKMPEKYSPTLTTRIKHGGKGFITKFFNQDKKEIEYSDIRAGSRLIPLIEATGLWFAGKSFGLSYKIIQVMVFETEHFDSCVIDNPYTPPEKAIDPAFNTPEENEPPAKKQKV